MKSLGSKKIPDFDLKYYIRKSPDRIVTKERKHIGFKSKSPKNKIQK
jgi:hypothetical protein